MPGFVAVHGGNNISPSMLSYRLITLDEDITLVWPLNAPPSDNLAAAKIDVIPTDVGLSITMPDARFATPGRDTFFRNLGANSFDVLDQFGGAIATVASGEAWYVYLRTNDDAAGTWGVVQFGTGSSTADAASLAGLGLKAIATTLNQDHPVSTKNATYTVTNNDRAQLLMNTGGSITFNFPAAATVGSGWFVVVRNAGSGTLTLDPNAAETIDDAATKALAPTESCIVYSDGSNLLTVGYGRSVSSTVSALSKSIAGTGTVTLTANEALSQVQNFTGILTGNRIIEYGTSPGYWFVYNNTTGAFTVTMRVNGADPGVAVTQGTLSILRSDGTTMSIAFTAAAGTVTSVGSGTGLTGGPITGAGTLSLANTAATPGTFGATGANVPNVTVDAQGRITASADRALTPADIFPSGSVILWFGVIGSAPAGWQICDGTNGTPDLRDRVPIGAGSTYALNASGGAASVTPTTSSDGAHTHTATTSSDGAHTHTGSTGGFTLTINEIPSHSHTEFALSGAGGGFTGPSVTFDGTTGHNANIGTLNTGGGASHAHSISSDGAHTHTLTTSSSGAHTHTVTVATLPPYRALYFIMRL